MAKHSQESEYLIWFNKPSFAMIIIPGDKEHDRIVLNFSGGGSEVEDFARHSVSSI